MRNRRTAVTVFLVIFTLCIAQAVYYYPQLPERVAQHFDGSGNPNGWTTKTSFLTMYLITIIVTAIFIPGLGASIRKMPNWAINIPNGTYWLAPERRDETLARTLTWMFWLGSATFLLLLYVFNRIIMMNINSAETMEQPWISLGVYALLVTVLCVDLFRMFGKKHMPEQANG